MLAARVLPWSFVILSAWLVSTTLAVADPTESPAPADPDVVPSVEESVAPEVDPAAEAPAEGEAAEGEAAEPMAGQEDFDKATALKLTAQDGRQISEVIQLLASALKKGLDEETTELAQKMLASTLMERGTGLATVLLGQPSATAAQDPRWVQLRFIALSDLTNAVGLDPTSYEGWILIGRLHLLPGGDAAAAEKAFDKVISLEETEAALKAEAYAYRAGIHKDDAAKLADLDKAIELDANKATYRLMRARHYMATDAFDKALADVDEVLKTNEEDYIAHEMRGTVLTQLGEYEEALKSFDRASEIDEDNIVPYLQRCELYAKLGNINQGIEQATKAIDRAIDNPLGYLLRADLYLRNNQLDESLADAEKVVKLRPGFTPAIFLMARIYDAKGDTVKAMEQLETLATAMPNSMEVNLQIAVLALQMEMPRRAITALDRAIEIDPDNALLYRYRADARLNISEHVKAIEDYNKSLELDPEDSGVMNNLAWTLATSSNEEIRDGKRAVELATKACELTNFEAGHILSTLAAAYAESGDFEKAIEWSTKAVELGASEDSEQLAEELASYKRGEPWRENKSMDAGEREGATPPQVDERKTELEKPSSSTPAPRRSIDF